MRTPAYTVSLRAAVKNLTFALAEAEAELPPHLKLALQHWIAAKHGPNAWAAVEAHVCADPNATRELKVVLLALKMAMECRSGIEGVLADVEKLGQPIEIPRIGKYRREG